MHNYPQKTASCQNGGMLTYCLLEWRFASRGLPLKHTAQATAILNLVVETLKLAPKLQHQGNQLTQPLDLTSSRWTFLGYIAVAERPLTVADLARRMHLKRQTVQRFADASAAQGFIVLEQNPDHKRAKLLRLTGKGQRALDTLKEHELIWAETVVDKLSADDIDCAARVLQQFRINISD